MEDVNGNKAPAAFIEMSGTGVEFAVPASAKSLDGFVY